MKTIEKKNQHSLNQIHGTESFSNDPKNKFMTLTWSKDDTDFKSFIRGGKSNLGCGWCGHGNPEG